MNKIKLDGAVTLTKRQQKMLKRARPRQKREQPVKLKAVEPTPEQCAKYEFTGAGMANKITPVIVSLLNAGKITALEYTALSYYRDQAVAADRSAIKSNIDFAVRSGNQRPIGYQTPQQIETNRIERDLGQLQPIARAMAVDDVSASQWAIQTTGGREKLQGKGVVIVPLKKNGVRMAIQDLKMAAHRIVI